MAERSSGSPILKTNPSEWGGLTKKQREANRLLGGEQRHTLLVGGASSGKTFTVVRRIMAHGLRAPGSRHAIPALSLECSARDDLARYTAHRSHQCRARVGEVSCAFL